MALFSSQGLRFITLLPLRQSVSTMLRFTQAFSAGKRIGVDIGFANAGISQLFRNTGGYWITVEPDEDRYRQITAVLGEDRVFAMGDDGTLHFEDRQFDVVVLARGMFADPEYNERLIKECHRILKTGGILLFTAPYRKKFGVARVFKRQQGVEQTTSGYTETEVFTLIKSGFDLLAFRYSCRFWVQMVCQHLERQEVFYRRRASAFTTKLLFCLAKLADLPLFWTRGHQMTVCARRKGWRMAETSVLNRNIPVSDSILYNPRQRQRGMSKDNRV